MVIRVLLGWVWWTWWDWWV